MPRLAQALNRTVLVAIPHFFGTDEAQACTLVDVEVAGLWLSGEPIFARIGDPKRTEGLRVPDTPAFLPFAQILYVSDPTSKIADDYFVRLARVSRKGAPEKKNSKEKAPVRARRQAKKTASTSSKKKR